VSEKVKAKVRKRDRWKCKACGMTNAEHLKKYGTSLHVHRIVPGSKYTIGGCVTLCMACHGPQPRRMLGTRKPLTFTDDETRKIRVAFVSQIDCMDLRWLLCRGGRPFRHQADFMKACIFYFVDRCGVDFDYLPRYEEE
jgi:hypothetical protein